MKESQYNICIPYEAKFAIFNGVTKRFFLVSRQNKDAFLQILSAPDDYKELYAPFLERMRADGFIVDDDIDELQTIRQHYEDRRHTNVYKLMILPTYSCNVACWYCTQQHRKLQLTDSDVRRIKQHIVYYLTNHKIKGLCLSWFGGEPLLRFQQLEEISEFAQTLCEEHDLSFENTITTNGILLSHDKIERMRELNFVHFQITIDGTQEEHDQVKVLKGCSAYETTLKNICAIVKQIPKADICLRYNYTTKNLHIKKVIDNLKLYLSDKERQHINLSIMKVWQEDEHKINSETLIKQVIAASRGWRGISLGSGFNICYVDQEHFNCVFPNGRVDKCDNLDPEKCRGIIDNQGKIVWESPLPFQHFTIFSDKDSECFRCKFLPICYGPCPKERDNCYLHQQHLDCRYVNATLHWQQAIHFYCKINILLTKNKKYGKKVR